MKFRSALSTLALLLCTAITCLAAKPESSGPDPDTILKNLYKAHDAQKGPFFDRKNRSLAAEYFTKELAGLIVKDAVASKGEVGAYEFDPLYQSQDPQVKNLKVGEVQWGGIMKHKTDEPVKGLAVVIVTFKNNGKAYALPFSFQQQTDKTWRISDIQYSDGTSLAGLLKKAYPGGKAK